MMTMDEIHGQSRVVHFLLAQVAAARPHHAYLFHGPAGVGKYTTAIALAKLLLCHDRQSDLTGKPSACGTCTSCRQIAAGSHHDLHIVTKELARFSDDKTIRDRKLLTIPVDVLREALIEPVYRAAQLNHGKVFILDEAELLNPTGQNLLLKTLEEPPAGTTIILVTSSEDRLLPTVRSRCLRLAFSPLPPEVLSSWLDEQVQRGEPTFAKAIGDLSDKHRAWLLTFAAGSIGTLQLALEYNLLGWAQSILRPLDDLVSGRGDDAELGGRLASCIDEFAKAWVERHDNASKDAANKQGAGLMWTMLAQHARFRLGTIAPKLDPADPDAAQAMLRGWLHLIDALGNAQANLAANANLSLTCDELIAALRGAHAASA
jgi:DNA polymerase-3 subunit delta'